METFRRTGRAPPAVVAELDRTVSALESLVSDRRAEDWSDRQG